MKTHHIEVSQIDENRFIKVESVAYVVGVSVPTINTWYKWKRMHPEHELAKKLPDFIQIGKRQTRYWQKSDLDKITEFKEALPQGRSGVLGDVTQKYIRNRKENNTNGSEISNR